MKPLFLLPLLAALLVVQGGTMLALQTVPAPVEAPATRTAYAVVTVSANVYTAPDLNGRVLGQVPRAAILFAAGAQQPNFRFVSGDGWQGWIAASDLTPNTFMADDIESARLE